MRSFLGSVVAAGCACLQLACAVSPAPLATASTPRSPPCIELPYGLDDLTGPIPITLCAASLEPPETDRADRARMIELIAALGPDDPHSLVFANEVIHDELAAANWEGFDTPEVHARIREAIELVESVLASEAHDHSWRDTPTMALACAHALVGERERALTLVEELYDQYGDQWAPQAILLYAELIAWDEQDSAIGFYERALEFEALAIRGYARYRLAYTLLHPQVVDQARAVELLEGIAVAGNDDQFPRLDLAIRRRAALELNALGRGLDVPDGGCGELTRDPRANRINCRSCNAHR